MANLDGSTSPLAELMSTRLPFLLIALCTLLGSCDEDTENDAPAYPDLTIYLDRFEGEARARGYEFDVSEVKAAYADEITLPDSTTPCGIGLSNDPTTGERRIVISKDESCNWANRTDLERENLFFHEIGHAFFNRGHEETRLCDGSPVTIMTSTEDNFNVYQPGEDEKRKYYIDELVDRLAALDQCIEEQQDWSINPVMYDFSRDDEDWIFYSDDDNYSGERILATDQSFGDKLTIKSEAGKSTENTGYWYTQFLYPNVPECAEVTFRVRMNAEQLSGAGASIAVRVYEHVNEAEGARIEEFLLLSTENNPAFGALDNRVEELTIPCFTRRTVNITVFVVMLPGTEGVVTFDDVQLLVKEQ